MWIDPYSELPPRPVHRLSHWPRTVGLGTIALAILAGVGILGYLWHNGALTSSADQPAPTSTPNATHNLNLVATKSGDSVGYSQIGTSNGQPIIRATGTVSGRPINLIFVGKGGDQYTLLQQDSTGYHDGLATSQVTINATGHVATLPWLSHITVNGITLTARAGSPDSTSFADYQASSDATLTQIGTTAEGPVYAYRLNKPGQIGDSTYYGAIFSAPSSIPNGLVILTYLLLRSDGTVQTFVYIPPFMPADNVPEITWSTGVTNTDPYRFYGIDRCNSSNFTTILLNGTTDGITQTGTTPQGDPIYEYTDPTSSIVNYYYGLTNGAYTDPVTGTTNTLTVSQYIAKHALFLYRDPFGNFVVFTNSIYGPQPSC